MDDADGAAEAALERADGARGAGAGVHAERVARLRLGGGGEGGEGQRQRHDDDDGQVAEGAVQRERTSGGHTPWVGVDGSSGQRRTGMSYDRPARVGRTSGRSLDHS